jgi:hypothetical protein
MKKKKTFESVKGKARKLLKIGGMESLLLLSKKKYLGGG